MVVANPFAEKTEVDSVALVAGNPSAVEEEALLGAA